MTKRNKNSKRTQRFFQKEWHNAFSREQRFSKTNDATLLQASNAFPKEWRNASSSKQHFKRATLFQVRYPHHIISLSFRFSSHILLTGPAAFVDELTRVWAVYSNSQNSQREPEPSTPRMSPRWQQQYSCPSSSSRTKQSPASGTIAIDGLSPRIGGIDSSLPSLPTKPSVPL